MGSQTKSARKKKRKPLTEKETLQNRERARLWAKNNPEKARKNHKNYRFRDRKKYLSLHRKRAARHREKDRERARNAERKWRKSNSNYYRARGWKKWGIEFTITEFDTMLAAQNNCCAICLLPFKKTPHVDHDHVTGAVRGLLCASCNMGIGMLKDDPKRVASALAYLSKALSGKP